MKIPTPAVTAADVVDKDTLVAFVEAAAAVYRRTYETGKSEQRTEIVDGRVRKSYGHRRPMAEWEVVLKDHHEGYIDWAEFERNQEQLAANAFSKAGGAKSGRGGRALLSGLLSCARCGRTMTVTYAGRSPGNPVYRCNRQQLQLGLERCLGFGGARVDAAVADEILRVVEPLAVEASSKAEQVHLEGLSEQQRVAELDLQQARYEASLAERRYAACDPDNRLIAAELEKELGGGASTRPGVRSTAGGNAVAVAAALCPGSDRACR